MGGIALVVVLLFLIYAWSVTGRLSSKKARVVARCAIATAPFWLAASFAVWFDFYSPWAPGHSVYFERLVGLPIRAESTLVACGWPDSYFRIDGMDVRVFRLPDSYLKHRGILERKLAGL